MKSILNNIQIFQSLKFHVSKYFDKSFPNWSQINKNQNEQNAKKKKKILIATSSGGLYSSLIFESAIGQALSYYGHDVDYLLCDKVLNSCIMGSSFEIDESNYSKNGPKNICTACFDKADFFLKKTGSKIHKFSDFLSDLDIKTINGKIEKFNSIYDYKKIKDGEIKLGEHAYAGTLRYYARTDISKEPNSKKILKNYLEAAHLTNVVCKNLFKEHKFDEVILNHGIYVPQGIVSEHVKTNKIKLTTWCTGIRKNTFCLTRGDTYHRSLIYEKNSNWENFDFNEKHIKKIDTYIDSRSSGKNDWIYWHNKPKLDINPFFNENNIDKNKPIFGLATNFIWDAQIDFPSNFFDNLLDWINFTIDFFKKNSALQLIIRVHPGEVNSTKPSKQKVYDEIFKKFPTLPKNIIVVPPENNISTYSIFDNCNAILIYGSKVGIEYASLGKPVIVCGEGFIRNKNIAIDITSKEHYLDILNQLPLKAPSKENILKAKKYAYHFFFRRMAPIKSIIEKPMKWPNMDIDKNFYENLKKDLDPGLKMICENFENNKDFIFEDEKYF